MSSGPDFLKDSFSFTVKNFYENKREALPQFVMVVQGYMGEILLETFGANQILRIHTYSKQPRVIAKVIGGVKSKYKLLSIPLNLSRKLCVIKSSKKVGKEQSLREIIDTNTLPVNVQFGIDTDVTIGAQVKNVSHFSKLQLIETFEEMYLLGNCVNTGTLDANVIAVPLYLPDLLLASIIGIRNKTEQEWQSYNEIMAEQVEAVVKFNRNYGNEDIAVYASDSEHTETMTAFVEPSLYANLNVIFPHMRKTEEVYANVDNVPGLTQTVSNATAVSTESKKESEQIYANVPGTNTKLSEQDVGNATCNKPANNSGGPDQWKLPPPVAPKPAKHDVPPIRPPPYVKPTNAPPPVPGHILFPRVDDKPESENEYTNDLPRAKVAPVIGESLKTPQIAQQYMTNVLQSKMQHRAGADNSHGDTEWPQPPQEALFPDTTTPQIPSDVPQNSSDRSSGGSNDEPPINIESLTVEDVSYWMRKLKLDKYVDAFIDNLIDGAILTEVDEAVLKSEFSFGLIESIRLMKFIRERHIPKLNASKF